MSAALSGPSRPFGYEGYRAAMEQAARFEEQELAAKRARFRRVFNRLAGASRTGCREVA